MKYLVLFVALFASGQSVSLKKACSVHLELYYETLCPYSANFIVDQLYPAYPEIKDIANIELIPFGNAKNTGGSGDNKYKCQHGVQECIGNKIQACTLAYYGPEKFGTALEFINCMEASKLWKTPLDSAEECHTKQGLIDQTAYDTIFEWYHGQKGRDLIDAAAARTAPTGHTGVPWVVIEGKHVSNFGQGLSSYVKKVYDNKCK